MLKVKHMMATLCTIISVHVLFIFKLMSVLQITTRSFRRFHDLMSRETATHTYTPPPSQPAGLWNGQFELNHVNLISILVIF